MPSQEDFQALARRYLKLADECTDPITEGLLRELAQEYFDVARGVSAPVNQQQQIQPTEQDDT
jgi:hypothetical protein